MSGTALPHTARCFSRTVAPPGNVPGLRNWVARQPGGVMLESVARDDRWGRFSIFAVNPTRCIQINELDHRDPFVAIIDSCRPWSVAHDSDLPFIAGWIGYLAYEAGHFVEPTAGQSTYSSGLPLAWWGFYDHALIADHTRDEWHVVGINDSDDKIRFWQSAIAEADEFHPSSDDYHIAPGQWNDAAEHYLSNVQRIINYIREGDVFQVNLARRYRAHCDASAASIYQRLCDTNPAAYSAFLRPADDSWAVLSSSPELFLHTDGHNVITRPIKGTRPRGASPVDDHAARRALLTSDKDRAELNMIIDLLRNDIGRVCEVGSVRVDSDGEIETLPTVFHRTATLTGRLREHSDALDLLRACFPGGSITGAPKVRAMQIISELEGFARGTYCGAIGYIGASGAMQLNIPIRTMTLLNNRLDLFVGSGIVADSDPQAEYDELTAKAAGMMAALHGNVVPDSIRTTKLHGADAR